MKYIAWIGFALGSTMALGAEFSVRAGLLSDDLQVFHWVFWPGVLLMLSGALAGGILSKKT